MTTTHEEYLDRAAQAVFGTLGPAEEADLRAHMVGCATCREAARGFEEAASAMTYTLPPATPSHDLKATIFARLAADGAAAGAGQPPAGAASAELTAPPRLKLVHDLAEERSARRPAAVGGSWRAAVVALGTGLLASLALNVYFWGHVGSLSGQVALLSQDKAAMDQKLAGMQQQAEQRAAQIAVLQASDTRMAKIPGQPMAKDASAMLFFSPAEGAWLVAASGLPPADAGKTYQLWAVTAAGQKISMGTFQVGADGGATVRVEMPTPGMKPAAAAVSLEPVGGMPQPTGPIVMMGEIKI